MFVVFFFFFLMIRRPPRSTLDRSSAASDVYKRQECDLQNNYYFLGNYFDSVDFDPGINQYLLVGDSGRIELFLAKYDQNFNLLWVDTFTTKAQMGPNLSLIHISEPTRPY